MHHEELLTLFHYFLHAERAPALLYHERAMRVCVLAVASLVAWFATIYVLVHSSLAPSAAGTEGHPDNHEHLLEAAAVTTLANPKSEAPHGDGKVSSGAASVDYLIAALQEENIHLRQELSTVKDTAAVL